MKKYTFFFGIIWVLAICTSSLKAQEISTNIPSENILKENITFKNKKFYIGIHGGYNFVLAPITIQEISIGSMRRGEYQVIPLRLSLGRGGEVGLNFGYMFNKYVGIELGASYLYTLPYKAKYSIDYYPDSTSEGQILVPTEEMRYKRHLSSNMANVSVSIILTTDFKKWNPYVKMGLLINAGRVKLEEDIIGVEFEGNQYPVIKNQFYEAHNKFLIDAAVGLGFSAVIGCSYNISPLVSIFAEWQFSCIKSMSFSHKILQNNVNGVDMDPEEPSLEWDGSTVSFFPSLRGSLFFNNTGLQIGVKFHL